MRRQQQVRPQFNIQQQVAQQPQPSPNLGYVDMPVETVVARLETACRLLHGVGTNSTKLPEISLEIQILSDDLRRVGPQLEAKYSDVLDRVMTSMRDASAQPSLPRSLRLAIFELVELRAAKFKLPSDSVHYYRQRRIKDDQDDNDDDTIVTVESPSDLMVMESAGDAKAYREEIVIKNSDSGRVMGVGGRRVHIIEAISDTIISFEKVGSSAKERVLSINGYSQQSINMAKKLIQETINRNASPVFDASLTSPQPAPSSSPIANLGDPSDVMGQYTYTVTVQDETIRLSGGNFQLVQEAKLALEDYFTQISKYTLPSYTREELLRLRQSVQSNLKPEEFANLDKAIVDAIVIDKSKGGGHSPPGPNQSQVKQAHHQSRSRNKNTTTSGEFAATVAN